MVSKRERSEGEKCDRCGEIGEDRRTLWHACFYDMDELSIPFQKRVLFQAELEKLERAKDPVAIEVGNGRKINIGAGTVTTKGELTPHTLYTLRVCKECRGDWMAAIKQWFNERPARESCGSGIFIRRNGATVEITEEEWNQLNPNREPVRFRPKE